MATKGLPKNERWYSGTLSGVPKYAQALGELGAVWAFLEHAFPHVLARVLNIPGSAAEAILFAMNSTSAKIDIIRAVTDRHADREIRKPIIDAMDAIAALAKRRNIFVHHMMGWDDKGRVCIWDFREPQDVQSRRKIVKLRDIEQLTADIMGAYNDLVYATNPENGPPPPKPQPPLSKRQQKRLAAQEKAEDQEVR